MSNTSSVPNHLGVDDDPRRSVILDEAIRTFAELGFRGADVQVIADRAGIGKGTVYRSFGTKEELFWATAAEVDGRLRAYISESLQEPPETVVDFLRAVAISYAKFFDAHPDCLEINALSRSEFRGSIPQKQQELYRAELTMIIAQFEEGMQRGELKVTDPRQASFAFSALMDGVVMIYCYSDSMGWQKSMVEQMQFVVELFLDGLRVPKNY